VLEAAWAAHLEKQGVVLAAALRLRLDKQWVAAVAAQLHQEKHCLVLVFALQRHTEKQPQLKWPVEAPIPWQLPSAAAASAGSADTAASAADIAAFAAAVQWHLAVQHRREGQQASFAEPVQQHAPEDCLQPLTASA
jgi:hypothetical protein